MSYRHTLPALALGFLLAVSASAQHNHAMGKDYDGGGGPGRRRSQSVSGLHGCGRHGHHQRHDASRLRR